MKNSRELKAYIEQKALEHPAFAKIWQQIKGIVAETHDKDIYTRMTILSTYMEKCLESSLSILEKDEVDRTMANLVTFSVAAAWTLVLLREEMDEVHFIPKVDLDIMCEMNKQIDLELGTYDDELPENP